MNDNYIDFIADLRKINIENSWLTRDEKEQAKTGIDCISDLLKLIQTQPKQNITVMGISMEEIRKIKIIAKQCSVEKVVLFPYPNGQNVLPFIHVYGGNKELFWRYNGYTQSQLETSSNQYPSFEKIEEAYGVILYESI